jgi:hypothetical protein
MKYITSIILSGLLLLLLLSSCSDWNEDDDRFVNTYRDILAIRLMFPDTAEANPKIRKIIKRYGYTKESFKKAYFEYTKDPEKFRAMLDSARIRAQRDYQKLDTTGTKSEQ